jgi:cytochrome P450
VALRTPALRAFVEGSRQAEFGRGGRAGPRGRFGLIAATSVERRTRHPENDVPELAPVETDYDHHSLAFAANPVETATRVRENGLTHSPAHGGFYALGRYEDVYRAALDNKGLISERDFDDPLKLGAQIPPSQPTGGLPFLPSEIDAPRHTAYRRAMQPLFTPKAVEHREARLRHWTTVCIDEVIESGRIDFTTDLTGPVAFIFFCEFLGLPVEEWRRWHEPVHLMMTKAPGSAEFAEGLAGEQRNVEVMKETVRARRAEPREDLISHLAHAKDPDGNPFSDDEVAALSRIVLFGAVDSVGGLIAHSVKYLEDHPEVGPQLVADETLMKSSVEEFLRYFSPGTTIGRTVGKPIELHGHELVPGDRVSFNVLAANRDPEAFDRPDEVVLDRHPNKHLAFGAGVHKCIGLQYARLEARVFLEQILTRLPDFEIQHDEAVPTPTIGLFSGYYNLPATFTPGERLQGDRRP